MSVQIRSAMTDDIEAMLPLVRDFVTSFEIQPSEYRCSFSAILDNPGALLLVAEEGSALVGYCLGFCHETFYANGNAAWVEELMVSATHRRQRIGEALMAAFEEWARTQGAVLCALATRRAQTFYRAIDYEESAVYFRKLL